MLYKFVKNLFWHIENWLASLTFFGLLKDYGKPGDQKPRTRKFNLFSRSPKNNKERRTSGGSFFWNRWYQQVGQDDPESASIGIPFGRKIIYVLSTLVKKYGLLVENDCENGSDSETEVNALFNAENTTSLLSMHRPVFEDKFGIVRLDKYEI